MDAWIDSEMRIVFADELYDIQDPKSFLFVCPECDAILTPCSFKVTNKKSAYFSAKNGHEDGCPYTYKSNENRKNGVIKRNDGFPVDHPSFLEFKKSPSTDFETLQHRKNDTELYQEQSHFKAYDTLHERTITSLGGVVEFYINNPKRRNSELTVKSVASGTYSTIFRQVKKPLYIDGKFVYPHHSETKIYFGMVSKINHGKEEDDKFIFNVYRKAEGKSNSSNLSSIYNVHVYKNKSNHRHTEKGISRYREYFRRAIEKKKENKSSSVYIFFVGKIIDRTNIFIVEDLRKVYIRLMSKDDLELLHNKNIR